MKTKLYNIWILLLSVVEVYGLSRKFHPNELHKTQNEHDPGTSNRLPRTQVQGQNRPYLPRHKPEIYGINHRTRSVVLKASNRNVHQFNRPLKVGNLGGRTTTTATNSRVFRSWRAGRRRHHASVRKETRVKNYNDLQSKRFISDGYGSGEIQRTKSQVTAYNNNSPWKINQPLNNSFKHWYHSHQNPRSGHSRLNYPRPLNPPPYNPRARHQFNGKQWSHPPRGSSTGSYHPSHWYRQNNEPNQRRNIESERQPRYRHQRSHVRESDNYWNRPSRLLHSVLHEILDD